MTAATVARAAAKRDRLRGQLANAEADLREAIATALDRGVSAVDVAMAAGVSRARVYQIARGE